jgi:hypothetical protein
VHPALLADKGCDIDTLLHLVGRRDLATRSHYAIRTVSAIDACKRVRYLLPGFRYNEQTDNLLFVVRNGASHLGLAGDIRQALRIMVRLTDAILEGLECSRSLFWGNRQAIVDTLRDESIDEAQTILSIKYEAARLNLLARLQGFSAAEEAAFKAIVAKGSHSTSDHEENYECPVCKSPGWLICRREYDSVESNLDPDDYEYVYTEPRAYPIAFECNVCGLELEWEEVQAAGMPNEIELPESEIGKPVR